MSQGFWRVFWGTLIVLNTLMIFQSVLMKLYFAAFFNFCVAMCCWVGYFRNTPNNNDEQGVSNDRE